MSTTVGATYPADVAIEKPTESSRLWALLYVLFGIKVLALILHFVIAFTVAYLLTGDVVIGGAVALVEPAVNTVGYYLHERIWQRFSKRRNMQTTKTLVPA